MRKNLLIGVLFVVLIISGECSRMQMKQGTLSGKNGAHILKKSSLGRALVQMIEMYTSNKSEKKDLSQLFQTLEQLKQSLLQKELAENESFQQDSVTHDENLQRIQNQITTLNEQIIILSNDLTTLNELKVELQTDLLNLETELTASENALKSEQEFLEKLKQNFETENEEFEQALQVLEEAISYLNEAYEQHEQAYSSFIQKNKNRIDEISILLETDMKKIPRSKFMYVEVLKNILLEMKSGAEIDSESIELAISALNDVHSYLTQGKEQLRIDFFIQQELHENVIKQLNDTIALLRDEQIPSTQRYIDNNQQQIDIKTESLEENQKNLEQEEENQRLEIQSWEQRVEYHDLLINQLQSEVSIIEQAENILQRYRD